jgi:hypothetical protein
MGSRKGLRKLSIIKPQSWGERQLVGLALTRAESEDAQGSADLIGCCRTAAAIFRMEPVITSGSSMRTM